ncbi:MAG: hypothetical protein ACXACU_06120 [Candidatus Hodarchaeales archaeon]|jgi:hypothetical protein
MYSLCTAFIDNGKIEETLREIVKSEEKFTKEIGVLFRKFFQCQIQPHILWSITEWESEKHHNQAANSIMKTRYDDRFASIAFGPAPYFEIFCEEEKSLRIGMFSEELAHIIIGHGLISEKAKEKYLKIREERINKYREKIPWLNIFYNTYNSYEFVVFMGFQDEDEYENIRNINDLFLEEYLFTGLRKTLGMSLVANYNQYICKHLVV